MSADQMKRLRRVFDLYDADRSGYLDEKELWALLQDGFQPSKAQMAVVMKRFDANGDGMLSRSEFLKYCSQLCDPDTGEHVFELTAATRQRLLSIFDELDTNGNGQLDVDNKELAEAMRRTLPVNQSLLRRALSIFDSDRDSKVTFDEFVDALAEIGGRMSALWHNVEPMDMSFPARSRSRKPDSLGAKSGSAKKLPKPQATRELSREQSIANAMENFRDELISEQETKRRESIAQGGAGGDGKRGKGQAYAQPKDERGVCSRACGDPGGAASGGGAGATCVVM